jgi:hypothetical protein
MEDTASPDRTHAAGGDAAGGALSQFARGRIVCRNSGRAGRRTSGRRAIGSGRVRRRSKRGSTASFAVEIVTAWSGGRGRRNVDQPADSGTELDTTLTQETLRTRRLIEDTMKTPKAKVMTLLDRSLIGLLIFIVMVLLGIHVVQTG